MKKTEVVATRRETDRSIERTGNYQAAERLTELGVLQRVSDTKLYHGRSGNGEAWHVRSDFDNAGDATGNANINKVAALNTGSYQVAAEFSEARRRWNGSRVAEVHEIVAKNPDARIIDEDYDWSGLSDLQMQDAKRAIRETLPSLSGGAPLDFEDRHVLTELKPRDFVGESGLMLEEDVPVIAKKLGLREDLVRKVGGSINVRVTLGEKTMPTDYFMGRMVRAFRSSEDAVKVPMKGENRVLPVNREYIGSWLKNMDVVGERVRVKSATLGGKVLDNVLLFELGDVEDKEYYEKMRRQMAGRLGKVTSMMMEMDLTEERKERTGLVEMLEDNAYAKPQELVEMAKKTPGYAEVFEADAGNWEGFRLDEHTRTVLQVFEDNYADKMPAAMLPMMKMALLVHDIGKPEAVRKGDKKHQGYYNVYQAEDFMLQNNVDAKARKLILEMIGNGMKMTDDWVVRRKPEAGRRFHGFCIDTMEEYLGERPDEETVKGFRDMCMVLQTCDSAAYTSMAVTQSSETGVTYKNAPSFNESFQRMYSLTGRKLRFSK